MQQLFNILALSVAVVSGTQTPEALVLTFGDNYLPHNSQAPAISDHVVQQILSLRLESETSLTLGRPDQDTISVLNELGGTPAPLFALNSEVDNPSRNLLVIDGVTPEIVSFTRNEFQRNVLASVSSGNLLPHLFAPTSPATESDSIYTTRKKLCELHVDNGDPSGWRKCIPDGSIFQESRHIFESGLLERASMVESWVDERISAIALKISLQSTNELDSSALTVELLRSVLHGLDDSSENGQITAVLLPRSNTHPGTTALNSRALNKKDTLRNPMVSASGAMPQSKPLHVAPVCFASNSSCNEVTSSCSGHGYCYRKSGSSGQTTAGDCYACRCQETTLRKDDGTIQKIKWGGSACHKRDISSPFFLIAGITILVLMATGAAIGMLYHIGQEQLPGVISAGVGTVRTQK